MRRRGDRGVVGRGEGGGGRRRGKRGREGLADSEVNFVG